MVKAHTSIFIFFLLSGAAEQVPISSCERETMAPTPSATCGREVSIDMKSGAYNVGRPLRLAGESCDVDFDDATHKLRRKRMASTTASTIDG